MEALKQSPERTVITVRSAAGSLPGADLLILFPNKTWKLATTDTHGRGDRRFTRDPSSDDGVRGR